MCGTHYMIVPFIIRNTKTLKISKLHVTHILCQAVFTPGIMCIKKSVLPITLYLTQK